MFLKIRMVKKVVAVKIGWWILLIRLDGIKPKKGQNGEHTTTVSDLNSYFT